jgi:hypothetical protein
MAGLEVIARSAATLTCKITGVTQALTVTWLKSDGTAIVTGGGFTVTQGL